MKNLFPVLFMLFFLQFTYAQIDIDTKPVPKTQKTKTTTSTGVGISIDLTSIFRSLKKNKNCNEIEMVFPRDGSKFTSNVTAPPLFRWKSSKPELVDSYIVQLVLINKREKTILYHGETDQTQIHWPEEVAWVAAEKGKATYQWYVMGIIKAGTKCNNTVESTKFTLTTTSPRVVAINADVDIKNPPVDDGLNENINLLSPSAISPTVNLRPTFSWRVAKSSNKILYYFKLVELNKDQSMNPGLAIVNNHSIIERKEITGTLLKYPETTLSLKRGKMYAWFIVPYEKSISLNLTSPPKIYSIFMGGSDIIQDTSDSCKQCASTCKDGTCVMNPEGECFCFETLDPREVKIVNTSPKNNSTFKNVEELNTFNWELIGDKFENPQYIIEVVKIGRNRQPERTYIAKTNQQSINAASVFKDTRLNDGRYRWKVTETNTGISSTPSFFSSSNCDFEIDISNEKIECLGYEGADRKFKICFDSKYSSGTEKLTFNESASGLWVYDTNNNASLSYTLVSHSKLLEQGLTETTINYCFEVIVSSSVMSLEIVLQGDDINPSPNAECIPGPNEIFEDLPSCICDDCDDKDLTFDDFNISLNGSTGNQFNVNGNINVNVLVYGLEFQIQSYTYSANPSACTEGVSSIEESGMILMPGTTINGSTSLQLFNETSSGSPNTNNNATKDIKYISNSPLTGPIPINLTIGLPGPITGLDPSCCVINYNVCIKVRIFYEDGNCKTCVFTKCFNFNNQ